MGIVGIAATAARAATPAASPGNVEHARAGERCEAAVAETIRRMRGREAREVEFIGAKRAIAPTPEEELGVKGEGRYRGGQGEATTFTYGCAFNAKTGGTSGVMFKESADAPDSPRAALQPDLATFSPEACESATAAALKAKYPRVGGIAFDPGTRALQATSSELTRLEGAGAFVRAPGMASAPFRFRCEFHAADGKVQAVETRE
jgi:hypothetical protein